MTQKFTRISFAFLFFLTISLVSLAQTSHSNSLPGIRVKISTDSGNLIIRLYDETPLHRDNFVKLIKEGFFDSLLFHRVIPEFMIQGGDPTSKNATAGSPLGSGGDFLERIPAEFNPNLIHKRGVLAAARDNNPEKKSSACQFYVVQGKKVNNLELQQIEQRTGIKYTPEQKNIYNVLGGTPFLDGSYTVFGETEYGFETIDKIANMARDANNRPLTDIRMKIEVLQ